MKNNETKLQWLQNEIRKDAESLEIEKLKFIKEIRTINKESLVPKPKKLTLWQKIKMILRIS
jgi:hypothetical protein